MKPLTRKEAFLAKIAGEPVDIEPMTREEIYLNKIAENGGGSSDPYAGYDIVFLYKGLMGDVTSDAVEIVKGDVEACEAKLASGLPVSAIFYQLRKDIGHPEDYILCYPYHFEKMDVSYTDFEFQSVESKAAYAGGRVIIYYGADYTIRDIEWLS